VLRRNYLGLEVHREGLRGIAIQRRGAGVALSGGQTLAFGDDVVVPAVAEPNIRKPDQFVEAVREVLLPLAKREKRIAVSLPDSAGHVYLLNLETPFKNHAEGLDIVRWQLKDLLPPKFKHYAADYQVLGEREAGGRKVLVSVIADTVLAQYEELLSQAGFAAGLVDFRALNLYNAYHARIELGSDFFLIGLDDDQLCMLGFENHQLDLCRTKTVVADPERIFQEINRSMVGYRRTHGSMSRTKVYLHSTWGQNDELLDALKAAFEREVELLPSPLQSMAGSQRLNIPANDARGMAAALGIAERMIQRVSK